MNVSLLFYCTLYALLNVAGVSLIKRSLNGRSLSSLNDYIQILLHPGVIGGFAVIFLSALVIFKALSIGKISIVSPLSTGINFAFTVLVGILLFHDKLSYQGYLGLILIFAGITLMSISK